MVPKSATPQEAVRPLEVARPLPGNSPPRGTLGRLAAPGLTAARRAAGTLLPPHPHPPSQRARHRRRPEAAAGGRRGADAEPTHPQHRQSPGHPTAPYVAT
ncbi:hypothetical protein DDE74_15275 [Streptomyces lydicus]|uniref:Uncharacterized protein n=1 Tax=Streptomyces lydicus TaxID=47763 RepID=A0A3Q9K1S1_9ACTN|nr:hypothetical protein DDE74_15275 [Streptomyces lydicus]